MASEMVLALSLRTYHTGGGGIFSPLHLENDITLSPREEEGGTNRRMAILCETGQRKAKKYSRREKFAAKQFWIHSGNLCKKSH